MSLTKKVVVKRRGMMRCSIDRWDEIAKEKNFTGWDDTNTGAAVEGVHLGLSDHKDNNNHRQMRE